MFCQKCGAKLVDGAMFCPSCGEKVVAIDSSNTARQENAKGDNVELKQIVPKDIKTTTEADRVQNKEDLKGMFFKKVEVSEDLIKELEEAEEASINNADNENNSEAKKEKPKKESFIKNILGSISDKDLDKPVYKTKVVIIGSVIMLVGLVITIILVSGRSIATASVYKSDVINHGYQEAKSDGWDIRGDEWIYYKDGKVMSNQWLQDGGSWYYLGPSGAMIKSAYYTVGNKVYYFDAFGRMLTNSLTPDGLHYAGGDGAMLY